MAEPIVTPYLGLEITLEGVPTLDFHVWVASVTEAVNASVPITGTGSPEGVAEARVGRWYVDTNAAPADVYFKATGDGDTGWVITS